MIEKFGPESLKRARGKKQPLGINSKMLSPMSGASRNGGSNKTPPPISEEEKIRLRKEKFKSRMHRIQNAA